MGMTVRGGICRIGTMLGHRWGCCHVSPPLWIADQVRNDVTIWCRARPRRFLLSRNELAPRSQPAAAGVAGSYLAASYSAWRLPGRGDDVFAEVVVHARLLLATCWIRLVTHSDGHSSV